MFNNQHNYQLQKLSLAARVASVSSLYTLSLVHEFMSCNLLKIGPPLKISKPSPSFLSQVVTKGAFLLKVRPPIYGAVHAVMLSKCMSIAESLHAYINRASLLPLKINLNYKYSFK